MTLKPLLRRKLKWTAMLCVAVPSLVSTLYISGAFQRLDYIVHDALSSHLRKEKQVPAGIAVVLIDDASLMAMDPVVGRWPWPRSLYADLFEFLHMGAEGPRAVLMDILFTETQGARAPQGGLGQSDRALVQATGHYGTIYHAARMLRDEELKAPAMPMPEDFKGRFSIKAASGGGMARGRAGENNQYYLPYPELYREARGIGIVDFSPDPDGVFRRTKLLRDYGGAWYPVLGFAPLAGDFNSIDISNRGLGLDGMEVPLDRYGNYVLNMYGKVKSYSISGIFDSLQKIRSGKPEGLLVDPAEFDNKIVFIGASAVGVEDPKPTPVSSVTPSVMLHVTVAGNLMERDFLRPTGTFATVASVFLLCALTIVSVMFLPGFVLKALTPLSMALLYGGWVFIGFANNRLYDASAPLAGLAVGLTAALFFLTLTEGREKAKARKMLGQYVSPQVLSEVLDKYDDSLQAEVGSRERLTVLFSDIRGFTALSETMPPDKLVEMLNEYFSEMSEAIFEHNGTVDKFIGDAIMAFWGAPIKTGDHAQSAVRAALQMFKRLDIVNKRLAAKGIGSIRMGVGINTGWAVLGNVGSERKLNYTIMGDTVNLASRVEGLTKQYGCDILISEYVAAELHGLDVELRPVDTVKIRGREALVQIYEVINS